MAYGDIGGAVTELVITCRTPASGGVSIAKGDAVKLTDDYTVDNAMSDEDAVFGQAMADASANDEAIPVKVRGVCVLAYTGTAPTVDGTKGVLGSATAGTVKTPAAGNGSGLNLKVDTATSEVHVLI